MAISRDNEYSRLIKEFFALLYYEMHIFIATYPPYFIQAFWNFSLSKLSSQAERICVVITCLNEDIRIQLIRFYENLNSIIGAYSLVLIRRNFITVKFWHAQFERKNVVLTNFMKCFQTVKFLMKAFLFIRRVNVSYNAVKFQYLLSSFKK